jgi:hypothetical protein
MVYTLIIDDAGIDKYWGSPRPRQALHDKRVLTSICHVRILSYTLRQQDIPFIAHAFFFLKKKKNSLMLPSFLER